MKKEIVIHESISETRLAILEEGKLVELYVERPENERMVGDIYKGKVENVVDAIKGAFVEIGMPLNGFLPFSDIANAFPGVAVAVESDTEPGKKKRPEGRKRPRLHTGQEIMVQVTKEPMGNKGARLTSALSIPGRFLVLVPNDRSVGVSRKISDNNERRRLRRLARSIQPEGFGLIIRTVAQGKELQILRQDLEYLMRKWKEIEEKAKKFTAPALIFKDLGITSSVIRDLFSPDIDRLSVDSKQLHAQIKRYLKNVAPALLPKLEYYSDKKPIFDHNNIESDITRSLSRKIWLKSGGHVIFDQTEAMMVVDVNTGRSVSDRDQERNALRTDLEAAREIARQLRLRDIGGIIVIDFIDLAQDRNRKKVVAEITRELKKDRAAFDILPMSDFGLVQLTRAREKPSLLYQYSEPCPRCAGLGRIPSKSAVMTQIEREIKVLQSKTNVRRLILTVQPDVAHYLKAQYRKRLRELMKKFFVIIKMVLDEELKEGSFKLQTVKQHKQSKSKDKS